MTFDVELVFRPPDGAFDRDLFFSSLRDAPFTVDAHETSDGLIVAKFPRVRAEGLTALPEALRRCQVSLSHLLREQVPLYNDRGLLWADVVAADVRAVV